MYLVEADAPLIENGNYLSAAGVLCKYRRYFWVPEMGCWYVPGRGPPWLRVWTLKWGQDRPRNGFHQRRMPRLNTNNIMPHTFSEEKEVVFLQRRIWVNFCQTVLDSLIDLKKVEQIWDLNTQTKLSWGDCGYLYIIIHTENSYMYLS